MLSPKSASGASPDGVVWTVRTVARVEMLWIVAGAGLTGVPAAVGEGGGEIGLLRRAARAVFAISSVDWVRSEYRGAGFGVSDDVDC